ncbi:MAG: TetR/AcrR family transcriptional regulator, partial [Chlamydiae bacterium]|nr:TetR/AcrR family transcriptional regulator [Chlamydiota bacterium]
MELQMARIVKKPLQRRSEILEAARHLFQTRGYERTTLQDVMNRLGIAKGTIYHYFKSKEELLEVAVEEMVNRRLEKMEALIQNAKGNALKKMQVLIEMGKEATDQAALEELHRKG